MFWMVMMLKKWDGLQITSNLTEHYDIDAATMREIAEGEV